METGWVVLICSEISNRSTLHGPSSSTSRIVLGGFVSSLGSYVTIFVEPSSLYIIVISPKRFCGHQGPPYKKNMSFPNHCR